MDPDTRLK